MIMRPERALAFADREELAARRVAANRQETFSAAVQVSDLGLDPGFTSS